MAVMPYNLLQLHTSRNRSHASREASVSVCAASPPYTRWGQEIRAVLTAMASTHYFPIELSQRNVDSIVTALFQVAGPEVQRQLVERFLRGLDPAAVLALLVAARGPQPPQR